jgi:hypothetical protein
MGETGPGPEQEQDTTARLTSFSTITSVQFENGTDLRPCGGVEQPQLDLQLTWEYSNLWTTMSSQRWDFHEAVSFPTDV